MQTNLWTSDEIAALLFQPDEKKLPFEKYSFVRKDGRPVLLGRGGSAEVYEAETRSAGKKGYAIKVIGFRKQKPDPDMLRQTVEVQKNVEDFRDDVVEIYDYTGLWVTFDEAGDPVSAVKDQPETVSGTTLYLQFIVMEKIPCVIRRTPGGNIQTIPKELSSGEEKEVLKLAFDVGSALQRAHAQNILHRDVKLENVFYSGKEKRYRLGDFGIARKTRDGFAGTVAFTKGYAAPEVRTAEDRYDCTADIYSFGMMLYVLMNGLKFPESGTYNVNSPVQYREDFVLPEPSGKISGEFLRVIRKACMYDPDRRYQSMKDMMTDIEKIMYRGSLGFQKAHKMSSLAAGSVLLFAGLAAWKLTIAPDLKISFSLLQYVFLTACIIKGLLVPYKSRLLDAAAVILILGVILMVRDGFRWWEVPLLFWIAFGSGSFSALLGFGALEVRLVSLLQEIPESGLVPQPEFRWAAVTMLSLAAVLLIQYESLAYQDRRTIGVFERKNLLWICIGIVYFWMVFTGIHADDPLLSALRALPIVGQSEFLQTGNLPLTGFFGMMFCLYWFWRERILTEIGRRKLRKQRKRE